MFVTNKFRLSLEYNYYVLGAGLIPLKLILKLYDQQVLLPAHLPLLAGGLIPHPSLLLSCPQSYLGPDLEPSSNWKGSADCVMLQPHTFCVSLNLSISQAASLVWPPGLLFPFPLIAPPCLYLQQKGVDKNIIFQLTIMCI